MKYCRKMKLVDCDENLPEINSESIQRVICTNEDDFYKNPHILSNLDKEMEKIIHQSNISDYDKWLLYNETLRRYLYFIRQPELHKNINERNSEHNSQTKETEIPFFLKNVSTPFNVPNHFSFHEALDETPDISPNSSKYENSRSSRNTNKYISDRKKSSISKSSPNKSYEYSPITTRARAKIRNKKESPHSSSNKIYNNWEKLGKRFLKQPQ